MNILYLHLRFIITIVAAFCLNIPLGKWRAGTKKFSFAWFALIHLAAPFIYYLRDSQNFPRWTIPIFIAAAVFGQLAGGRLSVIMDLANSEIDEAAS